MASKKPSSLLKAELLSFARKMRHESVTTEFQLWQCLRNRQLNGFKFRRQHPKPPFIANFYCAEVKLVVELDGDSHSEQQTYDASRTLRLERDGLHVIRFVNDDVHRFLDAVLEEILRECESLADRNHPHPNPLPWVHGRGDQNAGITTA